MTEAEIAALWEQLQPIIAAQVNATVHEVLRRVTPVEPIPCVIVGISGGQCTVRLIPASLGEPDGSLTSAVWASGGGVGSKTYLWMWPNGHAFTLGIIPS